MIVNGSQEDPLWIATTTTFQPPPPSPTKRTSPGFGELWNSKGGYCSTEPQTPITGYVTAFSAKIVALMIVTQPVVYVTPHAVTGRGKI